MTAFEVTALDRECDVIYNAGARKLKRMTRRGRWRGWQNTPDAQLHRRLNDFINRQLLEELFRIRYYEEMKPSEVSRGLKN
jgi:ribosomal protein S10